MEINEKYVDNIVEQIRKKIRITPKVAIILGSGLSQIAEQMQNKTTIKYEEINGMLIPNVKGHKNQFVIGEISGKTVIAIQGRLHPYDGFSAKECALPVYVFKKLGVETCIITNSAGGVNLSYNAGDIMLIKDHINTTGMNPLIDGPIIDYGVEFVDLKNAYDKDYRNLAKQIAKQNNIDLKEGVFLQTLGPTYETPAEVKYFRTIGADSVCMSTVLETIACVQCGIKVLAFSCIANKAVSEEDCEELTHEEVLKNAEIARNKLSVIIKEFIGKI